MAEDLPDDAIVCRGGTCTAERFAQGAGVTIAADGTLQDVSVNCAAGKTLAELSIPIPNRQVGGTTVGHIRAAGGEVTSAPSDGNPNHSRLRGISAAMAARLFSPTTRKPNR